MPNHAMPSRRAQGFRAAGAQWHATQRTVPFSTCGARLGIPPGWHRPHRRGNRPRLCGEVIAPPCSIDSWHTVHPVRSGG